MKLQIFHQITRGGFCPRQQSLSFIDNTVWFKNIKTTAGYQNTITAGETHTHTHTLSRMRKKILQSLGSMAMKDLVRVISQNYRNYSLFSDSLYPFLVLCMSNDELIHFVLYV